MDTAGGFRRFFADCIDGLLINCVSWVFIELIKIVCPNPFISTVASVVANIFSIFLYFPLLESSFAQATIGERLLKMRVCSQTYERLTFWKALQRHLIGVISMVLLGFLMVGVAFFAATARSRAYPFIAFLIGIPFCIFWYLSVFYIKLFSGGRQTLRDYFSQTLMLKTASDQSSVDASCGQK